MRLIKTVTLIFAVTITSMFFAGGASANGLTQSAAASSVLRGPLLENGTPPYGTPIRHSCATTYFIGSYQGVMCINIYQSGSLFSAGAEAKCGTSTGSTAACRSAQALVNTSTTSYTTRCVIGSAEPCANPVEYLPSDGSNPPQTVRFCASLDATYGKGGMTLPNSQQGFLSVGQVCNN